MKTFFLLSLLAISLSLPAKVLNVNNNPGIEADFDDLQEAINDIAVEDGDTLLLHGSTASYGSISIIKKVAIFGPGYFLVDNPNTQASLSSAVIGAVTINPQGSGSQLSGLIIQIRGNVGVAIEIIDASNILISRNFIDAVASRFGNAFGIRINGSSNGIIVSQNYINTVQTGGGGTGYCISGAASISNTLVSNNIITGEVCFSLNNAEVRNNTASTIKGGGLTLCFIENNIFNFTDALSATNSTISNNVITGDFFSNTNGNQVEVPVFELFIGFPDNPVGYSDDRRFESKPESPALGSGQDPLGNVTDCGAFGGLSPYKLSGVPRIPTIYFLGIPTSVNSGQPLPVRIKANAN